MAAPRNGLDRDDHQCRGLAAAVLLDALVVWALLLPAALVLLGRSAWWPGRLGRSVPPPAGPARRLEPASG